MSASTRVVATAHFPAQVPEEWQESDIYGTNEPQCSKEIYFVYLDFGKGYATYAFECRTATQSQMNMLVGNVMDVLRAAGQSDDTLVQTDSGSGNNCPLHGDKETDFEAACVPSRS